MDELRTAQVTSLDGLVALEQEWRALSLAHGGGLPFHTWEWMSRWWTHFAEQGSWLRDELYVRAFRSAAGDLVGVAPLMRTRRPGVGPISIRVLDFFGSDPNVTEHRGLLCSPEWEGRVAKALVADLKAHASEWDWMRWRGLREGGEALGLIAAEPGVDLLDTATNYLLPLTGTWETFRSSRPRNVKESLRKCYNSLKRDGHDFELVVATAPAEVRRGLERFLELHAARAALGGTVAHANVFAAPASRAFLLDVCDRLAGRNMVRIYQLRIAGQVVAVRVAFAVGRTLYLYFSGYDPAWADYSVMTTTVAEALRHAMSEGFTEANLSFGTDVSKTRWDPQAVLYRSALQVSPDRSTRLGRMAFRAMTEQGLLGSAGGALRRILGRKTNTGAQARG